jgi:hypothetical protein
MSTSQTPLDDFRHTHDVTHVLKGLSTAEGTSPVGAFHPKAGREASNPRIGRAGERSDFGPELRLSEPATCASPDPIHQFASGRPSTGRRIRRTLGRYCIAVLAGVGATLAWQSHGDEAKGMVITWVPSLGWLLSPSMTKSFSEIDNTWQPGSGLAVQATARDGVAQSPATNSTQNPSAAPAIAQQLGPVMLELTDIRRRVEVLSAKQEQLAQDIAARQAVAQAPRQKASSASPSRAVPIPPRKPPPAAVQATPEQSSAIQSWRGFPPPPAARSQ